MVKVSVFFCLWLCHLLDVTDAEKTISVMEGRSVTLNPEVTEVQKYILIQWMFERTRIAEFNRFRQTSSTYDSIDGRFRDRLKLDQTGSLTISKTRTTDSGLYQLTLGGRETKYMRFYLTVYDSPHTTSSPEWSSSFVTILVNSSIINQTENKSNTELNPQSSDKIHCCGYTEAVFRLALSALVGVATVAMLVYDIRSRKTELNTAEEIKYYHQSLVKSEQQCELSRRMSFDYVDMKSKPFDDAPARNDISLRMF